MENKKPTAMRYFLLMGLALFSWLIVGSIVTLALTFVPFFQKGLGEYLLVFIPYLTFFLALFLGSHVLLGCSLGHLINPQGFRTDYYLQSFFCYLLSLGAITCLLSKSIVLSAYTWKEILLFLPFTLVLITMQTTSEELFFRVLPARMVYGATIEKDHRALPLSLFSGVLFLLPHLMNPEVRKSGTALFSILFYFLWGVIAMFLGIYARGFEGVTAAHTANNLFVALFVNYQNSALPARSLFVDTGATSSLRSLLVLLILFALLWCLSYRYLKKERTEH